VRSQIHQIYSNEEKDGLYRMLRTCDARAFRRDSQKYETFERNDPDGSPTRPSSSNPFSTLNTVVCFTMALNDPSPQKKPLFEPPVGRTSFSAVSSRRTVSIPKAAQGRQMNFTLSGDGDGQYVKKLKNFFDFLFKVNFSSNIYVSLELSRPEETVNPVKYKVYIGKGNNSLLLKSLMKRRFWWEIADSLDSSGISFFWSQNIIDKVEARQQRAPKVDAASRPMKRRREGEDAYDLNRKILPAEKAKKVESFITKEGYVVPFEETFTPDILTNHLPRNYCIGSKKHLFRSLFHYFREVKHKDPFEYIPKTYHLRSVEDEEFKRFMRENGSEREKVWIVKPGENSNRGRGIRLATLESLGGLLRKARHENGQPVTYIVQSYINRPFLYNGRKFDIRHYMMFTSINGHLKAYWYRDGYVRTSSEPFDLDDLDN
jgi:hypothetical protein